MRKRAILLCALCLLLSLAACTQDAPIASSEDPAEVSPGTEPSESAGAVLSPPPSPDQTATPVPTEPPLIYTFGSFLEESEPIEDDSFFDDAVFLGDSRTEGFQVWGGIRAGDYFWKRGMSVFRVDNEKYTFNVDGEQLTLVGALSRKQYGKVYIMIGVNELGYPAASYERGLAEFIDKVIAAQPGAVIYLQTLPPVNDELASEHLASSINNENVNSFNEIIVRVAAEKRVVLLNTAEAYRDENGQLPADMTSDGCHFAANSYRIWGDYLRSHTMDAERYFYYRDMDPVPPVIQEPTPSQEPAESEPSAEAPAQN